MCDKAILENGGTLESFSDCYKNQQMCDKAIYNYPHALQFVPDCSVTHQMCDKDVTHYHSTIQFLPDCYMIQEMRDKAINICFFVFNPFPDWCKNWYKKCMTQLLLKILFR